MKDNLKRDQRTGDTTRLDSSAIQAWIQYIPARWQASPSVPTSRPDSRTQGRNDRASTRRGNGMLLIDARVGMCRLGKAANSMLPGLSGRNPILEKRSLSPKYSVNSEIERSERRRRLRAVKRGDGDCRNPGEDFSTYCFAVGSDRSRHRTHS